MDSRHHLPMQPRFNLCDVVRQTQIHAVPLPRCGEDSEHRRKLYRPIPKIPRRVRVKDQYFRGHVLALLGDAGVIVGIDPLDMPIVRQSVLGVLPTAKAPFIVGRRHGFGNAPDPGHQTFPKPLWHIARNPIAHLCATAYLGFASRERYQAVIDARCMAIVADMDISVESCQTAIPPSPTSRGCAAGRRRSPSRPRHGTPATARAPHRPAARSAGEPWAFRSSPCSRRRLRQAPRRR